ncbi:MAG: hypothetical protein LBN21_08995 [Treponema sp.]|nr:hypothetical protein [Treponema sp.]
MMKNKILIIGVLTLMGAPLFSASLDELVGPDRARALGEAVITEVQLKTPKPVLLPNHGELQRIIEETQADLGSGIFVESLHRYQKPAGAAQPVWSDAERTELYNRALALSTLAGIQYYSTSRKTMRTFYETSQVIDGPNTKRALKDPVFAEPPASLTLYARQKDITFGDNIYQYDYRAGEDALILIQQNLTAMTAFLFPAVGKNKLRSVIAVIDAEDSLLIYVATMAKTASLPGLGERAAPLSGLGERISNSFTSRTEAILKWFTGQADKAF